METPGFIPQIIKIAKQDEKGNFRVDIQDMIDSYLADGYYMLDLDGQLIFSKTPFTKNEEKKYREEWEDFIVHQTESLTEHINRKIVERIMKLSPVDKRPKQGSIPIPHDFYKKKKH